MIGLLKSGVYSAIGAAVAAAYFNLFVIPDARQDERRLVALEASQRAVELIEKGNADASELDQMSASDLCRELLGGSFMRDDDTGHGRGGLCDDEAVSENRWLHRGE